MMYNYRSEPVVTHLIFMITYSTVSNKPGDWPRYSKYSVIFQVVEDGYEFFAKRQLVTLFSAPNYCGEFDNAGAMMSVDETLMCSFQILKVLLALFLALYRHDCWHAHLSLCKLFSFNLTRFPFSYLLHVLCMVSYKMDVYSVSTQYHVSESDEWFSRCRWTDSVSS
jgi:hypothetical protein